MAGERWLLLLVVLTPLAALPGTWGIDPMQARNAVVIVGALALVVWMVRSWWLRAFLLWSVVACVWSGARVWGVAGLLGILAWTLLYREATRLSPTAWGRLEVALAASAVVQVAWLVVQALDRDPIFTPVLTMSGEPQTTFPLVGFFGNPMDLAVYLGLLLPLMATRFPVVAFAVVAPALVVLKVTAGLVALGITAAWWIAPAVWRSARRLPRPVAVTAGLLLLVLSTATAAWAVLALDPQGAGTRPLIWKAAANLAWMSPWVGWGPNAVTYKLILAHPATALQWNFLFNEWIQGAVEVGLPGVACAAGFVATLAWRLRARWEAVGMLAPALLILLALSTFSIPLRIGPVALVAALVIGRLDALTREAA